MSKYTFLFFYFFTLNIPSSFASFVNFSDLSWEELEIVHNLVPPSIDIRGDDTCGDYILYGLYKSQAEKEILKHRTNLAGRVQQMLADLPPNNLRVVIPAPTLRAYDSSSAANSEAKRKKKRGRESTMVEESQKKAA